IFQADYVHPFGKDHKLEAGVRASIRNIDNDFLVEEFDQDNDIWNSLDGLSNTFNYDEEVYAAYLTYGNKYGRFSYQLGLRPEYSVINTRLLQTGEENKRDYLNLFPTAHFNYELPADNAVQLSYSRRIQRPRFWDLNPFFTFTDNRNFFSGNPDLDPEFSHSLEFGHIKYWEKGSVSSSIYYRHTEGVRQRIRTVDEEGNSITRPENLATEDAYGLEFNVTYEFFPWWRFNADANFFRFVLDGSNVDDSFTADNFSWFTRGTSRFSLSKKTDIQVRFNYRAPQQQSQGTRRSISSVDIAASQDLWKDKATLTFSVRDLFNTRLRRFTTEGENFFSEGESRWRVRQASLTLNYRLNQDKKRGRGNRGGGGYGGGDEGGF
ncbi:MAG: outer membrane beta-barrel family protein, partial [Bacteroidota bacterium]